MQLELLFTLLSVFLVSSLQFKYKVCSRKESKQFSGETKKVVVYHCCSDYVAGPKGCRKCTAGYVSNTAQTECIICPRENYGVDCALDCACGPSQRCDNVVGCVDDVRPTGYKECGAGYFLNDTECVPCPDDYYGDECALKCDCLEGERCDNVTGCMNNHTLSLTTKSLTTKSLTTETEWTIEEDEIVVQTKPDERSSTVKNLYVLLGSIVGAIIFIMGVALVVYKRRNQRGLPQNPNTGFTEYSHPYDEIDEDLLNPDIVPHASLSEARNVESRITDSAQNSNGGYLDPVPSVPELRPEVQMHFSEDKKLRPGNQRASGYLHPYQPVFEGPNDIHEYSKPKVVKNKLPCEGKSDKVQPYQLMLTEKSNEHKYTVINGQKQILDNTSEVECDQSVLKDQSDSQKCTSEDVPNNASGFPEKLWYLGDVNECQSTENKEVLPFDQEKRTSFENSLLEVATPLNVDKTVEAKSELDDNNEDSAATSGDVIEEKRENDEKD